MFASLGGLFKKGRKEAVPLEVLRADINFSILTSQNSNSARFIPFSGEYFVLNFLEFSKLGRKCMGIRYVFIRSKCQT